MLDKIDSLILEALQTDSARKIHELARELRLPRSTVYHRIKKLETAGVIVGYKAVVDAAKLGRPVTVFVNIVTTGHSQKEVAKHLAMLGVVEEMFVVTGPHDLIAKVRLQDNAELGKFVFDEKKGVKSLKATLRTESYVVLETLKQNAVIQPTSLPQRPPAR